MFKVARMLVVVATVAAAGLCASQAQADHGHGGGHGGYHSGYPANGGHGGYHGNHGNYVPWRSGCHGGGCVTPFYPVTPYYPPVIIPNCSGHLHRCW